MGSTLLPDGFDHPNTTGSPGTAELVRAIDRALRSAPSDEPPEHTSRRVAEVLAPFLDFKDLVDVRHLEPDPHAYKQHVLHVAPDGRFSLVALVWLPGQSTPIHDHTTWCVVGTYLGEEVETTYQLVPSAGGRRALAPVATMVNPAGTVAHLAPPGDIHLVRNGSDDLVISLHVYGTDVRVHGTSIRRCYDEFDVLGD
ncbi:cysteine dioxygenase family protein [Saccharopolyspora phatthalungensis]|uniref:Putative metal-dependent enzyme (Double-stranded beta helix superfamily) n=1 Tax=Saccharopolyspora phatthalungensis TaxID=664693 RepID=A0A840QJQ8_9PSEU|nr:cysteine dioxygenase family protein [Saccharopolyspora phatthalungensis]MBB5159379.1 putative metal-dependent enzyme (double-stranded beta helix superfamily) [Saccharopolyspora phatthalungensis]